VIKYLFLLKIFSRALPHTPQLARTSFLLCDRRLQMDSMAQL